MVVKMKEKWNQLMSTAKEAKRLAKVRRVAPHAHLLRWLAGPWHSVASDPIVQEQAEGQAAAESEERALAERIAALNKAESDETEARRAREATAAAAAQKQARPRRLRLYRIFPIEYFRARSMSSTRARCAPPASASLAVRASGV